MKVLVFLLLIIPILALAGPYKPKGNCAVEIRHGCREQITEMDRYARELKDPNPYTPALPAQYIEYTRLVEEVMTCASKLRCFKGQPTSNVFETVVGAQYAFNEWFETNCMANTMENISDDRLFAEGCNKKYDFLTTNSSIKRQVFASGKDCFFKMTIGCVTSEKFLTQNYDALMDIYTIKQNSEPGFCHHPYHKFHQWQCSGLNKKLMRKARDLVLANVTNVEINEAMQNCRDAQKCMEESCLHSEDDKARSKRMCDDFDGFFADYNRDYKKLKCLENLNVYEVAQKYMEQCLVSEQNCLGRAIATIQGCEEEIPSFHN